LGSARSRAVAGAVGLGRRLGWLLVIVDVGLAPVLLVGVLVGLMRVDDGGVVVFVVVAGAHVLPLLAMPQIVGHVGMVVLVYLDVVAVGVGHGEPPPAWRVALPARPYPGSQSSIPRG
jgi:hypothetical protein